MIHAGIFIQLLQDALALHRSAEEVDRARRFEVHFAEINKEVWRRRDAAAGIIDVEAREVFDVPLLEKPD